MALIGFVLSQYAQLLVFIAACWGMGTLLWPAPDLPTRQPLRIALGMGLVVAEYGATCWILIRRVVMQHTNLASPDSVTACDAANHQQSQLLATYSRLSQNTHISACWQAATTTHRSPPEAVFFGAMALGRLPKCN